MDAPILLVVDEDPAVLEALSDALGRRFAADYRILAEPSPATALTVLEQLAASSRQVALVPAGQQLAGTSGVELLEPRSHQLGDILTRLAFPYRFYPDDSDAGRQLLTVSRRSGALKEVEPWSTARTCP